MSKTIYFSKELCANKFFVKNVPVPFDCKPTNTGVIALDDEKDKELVAALNDAVAKRRGGITLIDAATFEAIKKNKTGKLSAAFSPKNRLRVLKVPSPCGKPKEAGAEAVADKVPVSTGASAASENPSPANHPTPAFVPARGRVKAKETPPASNEQ